MSEADLGVMALRISDLSIRYGTRTVVEGFSLELDSGESVALTGPSGSGKTSILSAILGTTDFTGQILVAGKSVTRRSAAKIRRHDLGMVFQHGELMDELTALENVALGGLVAGMSREQADLAGRELLTELEVAEATLAANLSGGERQRVALARALVKRPGLILADEPTGSLDSDTRDRAAAKLFETIGSRDAALLLVTHDPTLAALADRAIKVEPIG